MSAFTRTALTTPRTGVGRTYTFARHRLLIADDMATIARRCRADFAKSEFEVVEADCGAEVLRLVQEQTVDVILLDVTMPDMNGTEVLRRIRKKFSASHLPVIMVTPNSQAEDVIEAMKIGANDYRDETGRLLDRPCAGE